MDAIIKFTLKSYSAAGKIGLEWNGIFLLYYKCYMAEEKGCGICKKM